MNCKPGDMAIIVRAPAHRVDHLGMCVEVLYAAPTTDHVLPDGAPAFGSPAGEWIVQFSQPIVVRCGRGTRRTYYASVPDYALLPIRPEELRETLREAVTS